jgi:hypothetical protein
LHVKPTAVEVQVLDAEPEDLPLAKAAPASHYRRVPHPNRPYPPSPAAIARPRPFNLCIASTLRSLPSQDAGL